jgi:hypothetical protein
LTKNIFAGKTEITEEDFIKFKHDLQELLWHYEFNQFDVLEDGTITAFDFAMSLIIYFPFKEFNTYLKHITETGLMLQHQKITQNEFIGF